MEAPQSIENLQVELAKLPGIGPKSAERITYWMLDEDNVEPLELAGAIIAIKRNVHFCKRCFNYAESELCPICEQVERGARDASIVCVVAEPKDIEAIEKTAEFRGAYHVLGGVLDPINGIDPTSLKIEELLARVRAGGIREVLVATSPTTEGEATASYLAHKLKPLGVAVTRLAIGLPLGGNIEYADAVTLSRAIELRREL
ncbi:MAG: recombination mediator RecR [Coriobacteriales bacterium]|jgi:recombination protein RecR|nr:recombination mediator RecR [Coriobacteriales bacterium]